MKRNNVRRLLALVLVAALCLLCGAAAQPNATEIHIYSADDLVQLSKSCKLDTYSQGKTVYLDNDVDLSGSDFVPIPTFGGMFEGQGHTVSGLELSGDASHMGLFRYVQAVGTVRDLKITGNIDAAGTLNEIGAVVGTNYGTISGCSFNGTISGENNVGGIAGTNESSGMIYNCKTEGFVEGDHYVGGIVGQNIGTISYCSNTTGVNINASEAVDSAEDLDSLTLPTASDDEDDDAPKKANTSTDVGGICGFSSGVIIGCTNWGGVGFEHVGYNIGGIVGRQSGLVSGCTNWGTASGRKDVGGICGQLEPFITLDVESGSIGAMAKELNTLHDLMDTLLNHTGAAASSLAATVGVLSDSAARATESARYVAERTTDYVDNTVSTVNEVFIRINTAEKMLAPAITEFSTAAVSLDKAIDYFNKGFDYLDIVDEMTETDKTAFKDAAKDLSVSSDQLNAAMDYCAWLMKVMDNAYGTGSYDLIASRPDNWQQMSDKYGYEYNPDNLGTYESQRDALLKGMGDAAKAIGAISGDISTMTKIINLYYLTEDSTGHTRLDYMSAAFKNAFDALKASSGNFSTGMSYLDQVTKYLASNDPLDLPDISSDYRTAMEQMFDDLGSISAGLSRLSVETATYSNQIVSDMKAVNDQFNVVMMRLCDILELALSKDKKDIIEDVSEEELSSTTDGKVYNCDNYGKVDGDVNVGGVAGTMDIEYDFDPESDSNVIKDSTLTAKYFTKCVLLDSKNYGDATSRKDCAGAICGYADLGVISGCEGYGTAETDGPTLRGNQKLYMKYNVEILNDTVEDDTDNTVSLRVYAPDTGASYTVYTYQNGTWASTSSSRDGSYLVFKTMDRDLQFAVVKAHHGPLFYILIVLIVLAVIVAVLRLLYCRKLKKAVAAGTMTEEEAATLRKQGLRMWLGEERAKLQAKHAASKEAKEAKRAAAAEAKAAAEAQAAAKAAEEAAETAPADSAEAAQAPAEPDAPEAETEAEPEAAAEGSAESAQAPAEEADTDDADAPQHP